MSEHENGRPGRGGPVSSTATKIGPDPTVPRCAMCGHPIWSRESILAGIGKDCRRELRRATRDVSAVVWLFLLRQAVTR